MVGCGKNTAAANWEAPDWQKLFAAHDAAVLEEEAAMLAKKADDDSGSLPDLVDGASEKEDLFGKPIAAKKAPETQLKDVVKNVTEKPKLTAEPTTEETAEKQELPDEPTTEKKPSNATMEEALKNLVVGSPDEVPDHPQGDDIRCQVEYYFSDENLPGDDHLRELMRGNENKPVSIKHILGFAKMRKFKPKTQVVQALKKSTFLNVTPDGKEISRKVPFTFNKAVSDEVDSDDEYALPKPPVKAPKPPRPPKAQPQAGKSTLTTTPGMHNPTGFEEYWADAPVTPAEFKEEQEVYDKEWKSFPDRIEIAIQRYKARRKFHAATAIVFNAWMKFGGIETGPKMFNSMTEQDKEGRDAADIAQMTAIHHVGDDKEDEKTWAVDFVAVAKGFLSSELPSMYVFDTDPEEFIKATNIMTNFYNYLIHHNVCAEYNDDILAARAVCALAAKEMPLVLKAEAALPGMFNVSCSILFGGKYEELHSRDTSWDTTISPMRNEEARSRVLSGLLMNDTEGTLELAERVGYDEWPKEVKCSMPIKSMFEVISIEPLTADTDEFQKVLEFQHGLSSRIHFEPYGILRARHIPIPEFQDYDLPPASKKAMKAAAKANIEDRFILETSVLDCMFVGMKFEGTIRTMGFGVAYIDSVEKVYCSFYEYLPNELIPSARIWRDKVEWFRARNVPLTLEEEAEALARMI